MSEWDEDIAALDMSDAEKNGLQVYRNCTKAFEMEQVKQFAAEVNSEIQKRGQVRMALT
ncbi:hypothetical protein [Pseudomonas sp. MYb185]|uniref:hypothetical protein n=1 Tax=Pseudomonas sp. MYb185 TaxID=1848729 RepID=UPI001C491B6A|nr:hypothetical protein [Pseudomonas sp. MYb185]